MPGDFPELIDPWRLLRAADVARALNVSRSTVYAWAESGILPTVRIGATIRFDLAAVRRAVEKMQHGGPTGEPAFPNRRS
ncbi:MAG: DNA-binding protein [Myxococcaceae bacterium]|nr:MAG: DNA-binding protein [Myxococcaceae bacterium]